MVELAEALLRILIEVRDHQVRTGEAYSDTTLELLAIALAAQYGDDADV